MDRETLEKRILESYNAELDHPWMKYPDHTVYRHPANRKWFALIMKVPKSRLGLVGDELLDVVNLKCDPILIGSLCAQPGFFPAYHMNKDNWITAALDGSAADEQLELLLDVSFAATAPKRKKKKQPAEAVE